MIRYEAWATDYEKEHWNAAASGADYAARLLKNFKVLRLKVQWDFTQHSFPSVVETLKEFSSPSKHEELDRIKSQFVPGNDTFRKVNYELWKVAGKRACWLALQAARKPGHASVTDLGVCESPGHLLSALRICSD